jgi:V8-like Glu-specific endopeptidase
MSLVPSLKRLLAALIRSPRGARQLSRLRLEGLEAREVPSMTPVTTVGYPDSAVVHVVSHFADGVVEWGSGTMIDANHVLTAGHCLYSARHGGFATSVSIYANQIGNYAPFGVAYATHERTFGSFIADERDTPGRHAPGDGDVGLLTLDRALGNRTGWFGWGCNNNDNFFRGLLMNTKGYPADQGFSGTVMYSQAGYIQGAVAGSRVGFGALHWSTNQMSCIPGQSGSAMYLYAGGHRTIYGVLDVGNNQVGGYAERITPYVYNTLLSWIAQDSYATRASERVPAAAALRTVTRTAAPGAELTSLGHLQGNQALFVGAGLAQAHALPTANDLALQALAAGPGHEHEQGASLPAGKAAAHRDALDEALFGAPFQAPGHGPR